MCCGAYPAPVVAKINAIFQGNFISEPFCYFLITILYYTEFFQTTPLGRLYSEWKYLVFQWYTGLVCTKGVYLVLL